MIIEMITGKVFDPFIEINWNGEDPLAPDSLASKISLKAIIETHKLDLSKLLLLKYWHALSFSTH